MKKTINIKYVFIIFCIYMFVLQSFLQNYIGFFKYFDELLALVAIPVTLLNLKKWKDLNKNNKLIFIFLIIIVLSGVLMNLINKFQPFNIVISDLLIVCKFFLVYNLSSNLINNEFVDKYKEKINKHVSFISSVLFILTILNYIFKIWETQDYRFGIMSNQLFFGHPSTLAAVCVFLMAMIVLTSTKKQEKKYILLLTPVLISTLRYKAIGACVIILLLIIYLSRSEKKISVIKLGVVGIIAIVLAWSQISFYFFEIKDSARKTLIDTSVKIATDYFPFGSGFGTFGSYFSSVNYSPIYYKYGIQNIYGLSYDNPMFLMDSFWPMIIGQFGFTGLILMICIIIFIFKNIQDEYNKDDKQYYIAKIICLVYLIISSTSESAFVNPINIPLALILGINYNQKCLPELKSKEKKEKNNKKIGDRNV